MSKVFCLGFDESGLLARACQSVAARGQSVATGGLSCQVGRMRPITIRMRVMQVICQPSMPVRLAPGGQSVATRGLRALSMARPAKWHK